MTGNAAQGVEGADPLFESDLEENADPETQADLQLAAGSPCVNTGNAEVALLVDLAGNERPCRGLVDLGAYESCDERVIYVGKKKNSTTSYMNWMRRTWSGIVFDRLSVIQSQGDHKQIVLACPPFQDC